MFCQTQSIKGNSYGVVKVYKKRPKGGPYTQGDVQLIIKGNLVGMEISVGAYRLNDQVTVLPITEIISKRFLTMTQNTMVNLKKLLQPD